MIRIICIFFFLGTTTLQSCKSEKHYTNVDVIENYQTKESKIAELKEYYASIVPKNKFVEIEFDADDHLLRFGIFSIDTVTKQLIYPGFLDWDLKTNSDIVKDQIAGIGWNSQTLAEIKRRLDNANCISIESGEPCKIGFQRRGLGKYYYLVFYKNMSDSLKKFYRSFCPYRLYNDNVVFEWGAGALGSDCYPEGSILESSHRRIDD
jgi:hypothetical protein